MEKESSHRDHEHRQLVTAVAITDKNSDVFAAHMKDELQKHMDDGWQMQHMLFRNDQQDMVLIFHKVECLEPKADKEGTTH